MARKRRSRRKEEPVNFWESFLFKFSSRLFLSVCIIVIFLTLTQCTVKKPEAPEFNTTFVVPIINRTYDMEELVSSIDQDEIFIDTTGDVAFAISEGLDTVQLNQDDMSVPDLSYAFSEVLGNIGIETPSTEISVIDIDSLTMGFSTVPGFDSIIVPPNTPFTADNHRQLDSFEWAEISSGSVRVVVTNELGLSLYDVVVRLIDDQNDVTIDTGYFATPLDHNDVDSMTISLAGKTFSDSLRISVSGHSDPGSLVILSPAGKRITTVVSFPDGLQVASAQAAIPVLDDLPFSERVGLDLQSGETIDIANLAQGNLDIAVTNNTPITTDLTISLPNLQLSGVPLVITRQVTAGETAYINAALAGYDLIPANDSIDIDIVAALPGSGGSMVLIRQTDSLSVSASMSNLGFGYVTGLFANSSADFDGIHEELDIPEGFDNISLVTAILTLEVQNGVDLPGHLDVLISGSNGKTLNIVGDIEPRGSDAVRLSTIVNDEVADFLSPLPEEVDISGTVTFGDGSYHGTIRQDDFVFATVRIYAPLEVRVNNAEITDLDIEVETIDQDDIDAITDHVVNARFIYSITNHLPLGVTALVHLSNDSSSLYDSPLLTIDTLAADPAPVSLATGIASSALTTEGEIHIDSDDIQILKNDSLFIRQQLYLNASDTSGVRITENDYITIQGRIEVEYRFDGEF